MKRKHLLMLGAAVAISAPLITWFAFNRLTGEQTYCVDIQGPRPLVLVVGGLHSSPRWVAGSSASLPEWLSREGLHQIRRAIGHDMWHKAFSSVSWRTLQEAPHSLCLLATWRIKEVELLPAEGLEVRTRSRFGDYFFVVRKGQPRPRPTIGPTIGFGPPAQPKARTVLNEAAFAESLSNHATLTFGH